MDALAWFLSSELFLLSLMFFAGLLVLSFGAMAVRKIVLLPVRCRWCGNGYESTERESSCPKCGHTNLNIFMPGK